MPDERMRRLRIISFIVFLSVTALCFGQTERANVRVVITNKVENSNWFNELATLKPKQQIYKLKQRLLYDTIGLKTDSSWTARSIQPIEIEYYCTPLIIINEDTIFLQTPSQTKTLVSVLDATTFSEMQIFNPDKAREQYGKWGACGIVLLSTNDKKVKGQIREIVR